MLIALICESKTIEIDDKDLEEEDASTDGGGDNGPAGDEEVAGVVADHVVHRQAEPPDQW